MDKLRALEIYIMVFESSNYTEAAKQCGMTPSAVSRSISKLEQQTGIKLLRRNTRHISPTVHGNQYYQTAKRSLRALTELEKNIKQDNQSHGLLTINVPFDYGKMYIQPIVSKFAIHYPNIQIELQFTDHYIDPTSHEADLFFRTGPITDSRLFARKISPMDFLICASPNYLKNCATPATKSNFLEHSWIRFRLKKTGRLVPIMLPGEEGYELIDPGAHYITDYGYIVAEMCADGLGITQMPHFLAKKWLDSGDIVPLLPSHCPPTYGVYALFSDRDHLPVRARLFLDFLCESVKTMGESPDRTWCQNLTIYSA